MNSGCAGGPCDVMSAETAYQFDASPGAGSNLQVHQRDVRMVRTELVDRFAPIRRFGDYTHVRLPTH
jgi:hypothetical protein